MLNYTDVLSRPIQRVVKRAVDRVCATAAVVILAPCFAAIGAAIKLEDGGPIFFTQERPGKDAKPFRCWKFRTMVVDADEFIDERGRPTKNRVTKVGHLLRWSSLDELPQLINIARGEMSFVGPRPPMMGHLLRYNATQMRRFRMRPGITGLAQVRGRNQLRWTKRLEYDNEYIDSYSLWLDFKILCETVRVVLLREGIVLDRNPDQVDDLPPPRTEGSAE